MADARYAARGRRRRRPPPDAVGARRAPARPRWPSGCPGCCPTSSVEESLELTAIHSLAGALEPGRRPDRPAAVLRAAPRRQQGQPARRRHRPGAARRGQPGPLRRAVPRRVPALPRRRHRRAAPAARERRGHHRPRRGVGHLPGPRHGGDGLQPVPVRRLPPPTTGTTAAPAPRCARRDYRAQGHRSGRRPHRHHPPRRAAAAARAAATRWRAAGADRRRPGPGRPPPARARQPATPARAWRLNSQVPGAGAARERWPLRRRRPTRLLDAELLRRPADPARRRPGAPARLDGRRPARASTVPGSTRSTSRCGCAPATRCCVDACDAGGGPP